MPNSSPLILHCLGTGNAAGLPRAGCCCKFCRAARNNQGPCRRHPQYLVEHGTTRLVIEAGNFHLDALLESFIPDALLLSHFDDDHCWGLGHLRWSLGKPLPVYSPSVAEEIQRRSSHGQGLNFSPAQAFEPIVFNELSVTPLPLQHGKPCFGWAIASPECSLAYLSDTCGLPEQTHDWLRAHPQDLILLDAGEIPESRHHSHNSIPEALAILSELKPTQGRLIHLGCEGVAWLANHPDALPPGISPAEDGDQIELPS